MYHGHGNLITKAISLLSIIFIQVSQKMTFLVQTLFPPAISYHQNVSFSSGVFIPPLPSREGENYEATRLHGPLKFEPSQHHTGTHGLKIAVEHEVARCKRSPNFPPPRLT